MKIRSRHLHAKSGTRTAVMIGHGRLRALVLSVAIGTWPGVALGGQATASPTASGGRLRVFVEACQCFPEFLRSEILWVDFVRQPQDADVQILAASGQTGAGGAEVVLRFVGHGRFAGVEQELRAVTLPGEPEDVRRRDVLRAVQVGLLGFGARDGLPADLQLRVGTSAPSRPEVRSDPWNYWVFRLAGDGSVESEESNREETWEFEASADRVTDRWILSVGAQWETQTETFNLDERDEAPLAVKRRERRADWFGARSLGPRWSVGVDGTFESSTFGNVTFRAEARPALEFNLFPYAEYATRQLRFAYSAGVQHARYSEITLFDRMRETRPRHALSATLDQRQPWGTLQASVEWSQYLHDLSKSRFEAETQINVRIFRGFSLEVEGRASRIRDQLSLPKRNASPEEVLLRVRQLQSGHQVELSVGLAYTFGSIFNNIVNPRFGRN
jgi:hypothetical protein